MIVPSFPPTIFIALLTSASTSIILQLYMLTREKPVDSELTSIFGVAKSGILHTQRLSAANVSLEPVFYAKQVVAPSNYFVKVAASSSSGTSYMQCRLFRPLHPNHNDIKVVRCRETSRDAPITYF